MQHILFEYNKPEVKFIHSSKHTEDYRKKNVLSHTHKTQLHFSQKYF